MKNEYERRILGVRRSTSIAALLATLSSAASIAVAVTVGLQRGAVPTDQVLIAGVNVIAVLAAQLLPALGMQLPPTKKFACLVLWLACVAYSVLGHAWYLLAAQERNGLARAQAVLSKAQPASSSARDRQTILNDKVKVADQLARLPAWTCDDACTDRQRLRKAALAERLVALDAELEAGDDMKQSRLQLDDQVRQAKEDLVGSRLPGSLGVTYATATWIMALTYALVLEGVGCLCWAIVFKTETNETADTPETTKSPEAPSVTVGLLTSDSTDEAGNQVTEEVTAPSHESDGSATAPKGGRSHTDDLKRVASALGDSKIRLTVNEIRMLLCCSQKWAQALRKAIADGGAHSL